VGPDVDIADSVAGMLKVIGELSPEKTGAFLDYKGNVVQW
jgi:hypothetical protein